MRKLILLIAVVMVALVSCSSLPKPESEDDSLVIGSLVLDFPDGFFDRPPDKFSTGVQLRIVNQTQGTSFDVVTTSGGYFWFMSNGTDSYMLERYTLKTRTAGGTYSAGGILDYGWTVSPGRIDYIGHFVVTYKKPDKMVTSSPGERDTTWKFDRFLARKTQPGQVKALLSSKEPASPWNSYEVSF